MRLEEIFPYGSFRAGQRELSQSVYSACKNREPLVVEAISGFGKTAAVLAGSLLAAEEGGLRIVYACRTKRQVFRVLEEAERIQKKNHPLRVASLFTKGDYCLLKRKAAFAVPRDTFKWYCNFNTTNNLCSYFLNVPFLGERITRVVDEISCRSPNLPNLLQMGQEMHFCPYEVAKLAALEARVIVTTYHYVFDDASRESFLATTDSSASSLILILDEAHNIREFMRDSSTISISLEEMEKSIIDSRQLNLDRVSSSLQEVLSGMKSFLSSHSTTTWYLDKEMFLRAISQLHDTTWLSNVSLELSNCASAAWYSVATGRSLPSSILRVGTFLKTLLTSIGLDDVILLKDDTRFMLANMNVSSSFLRVVRQFACMTLLSATVNPTKLFLKSIGLEGVPVHKVSIENSLKAKTIIDAGVSTRFRSRSPEMYSKIAQKIETICGNINGGIGIFVPSYTVLESIEQRVHISSDRKLLIEKKDLGNIEAENIISAFKSTTGSVLLAVQGGRFSEGEDFPGDQMDVSVVVGLSLPPPSPKMYAEYKQLSSSMDKHEAYLTISLLPALRKAFQAAGRHMRTPDKRGMVFFLDGRFDNKEVLELMPSWLKRDLVSGNFQQEELEQYINTFKSSLKTN